MGQILPLGGKRALNSWVFPEFQRTNLIRDMRKNPETKENSPTIQNHNSLAIQSKGPVVSPQEL